MFVSYITIVSYLEAVHIRHFCQAFISINICILICFCDFYLSCPKLDKDIFIENYILYTVQNIFKIVLLNSILFNLVCFDLL